MSWLRKIFGGKDDLAAPPITLDMDARREQLQALEDVLDKLVEVMKSNEDRMANPGWRERMAEYRRISGEAYTLRRGTFDREKLLDLAFEIRPVFTGELPDDVKPVQPLQEEAMRAAKALQEVLPGEQGPAAQS
jgi:hypothetical protein